MTDTVLVTGATGFVAKHCIAELLRHGYRVRGTVRDIAMTGDAVTRAMARAKIDGGEIALVAADLTSDAGWDEAVAGCRYVLHVASPFPITQPTDRNEVIRPALDGTRRVLEAATRAGVERVVMTSSTVAVMYTSPRAPGHVYTESDWTDPERGDITPYIASKTLAEKAAWDFVGTTAGAPSLVAINPGFILGPVLDPDQSTSIEVLRLMGTGAYPGAPRIVFPVVDVRDVAALHVKAMTEAKAAGARFLATNGSLSLYNMGKLVAEAVPDIARKVPKFEMPDMMVRAIAIFDKRLRTVLPELGVVRVCANNKARDVFGHVFHTPEEAVRAGASSLRALRMI
ncbi:MAG: aldehyde reductase [Hyphomicrobiaceae bacterium]|nr:aldehyde reductase [Hyphomicrobiaceae bacterium]